MTAHVFVLGLDEPNLETLRALSPRGDYEFHPLLSLAELRHGEELPFPTLLERAEARVRSAPVPADAIIGYWDFPVSSMVPMLCARLGLPAPSVRSVVTCEHKYWSRLEQQKVISDYPSFALVDLHSGEPPDLRFPMWLKPVKAYSSKFAFKVGDRAEFATTVDRIRPGIDRIGAQFNSVLSSVELPPEVSRVGGQACLAEEAAGGRQVTVEGYVRHGQVRVYGVVDSLTYPDSSSFLCYRYPSRVPDEIAMQMSKIATKVITQIGLNESPFNIEFFWDAESEKITLLEINPRISQSHGLLFEYVDGVANHHCLVKLGLGEDPEFPHRQGRYRIAGKWFLRRFADGTVRRSPTPEEISALEAAIPGVTITIQATVGSRLSRLRFHDAYSFELATLHIGADDEAGLQAKYEDCVQALTFEFD